MYGESWVDDVALASGVCDGDDDSGEGAGEDGAENEGVRKAAIWLRRRMQGCFRAVSSRRESANMVFAAYFHDSSVYLCFKSAWSPGKRLHRLGVHFS